MQQDVEPDLPTDLSTGLLVILTHGEGATAAAALELAASAAALGRQVALFCKCWPLPDLSLVRSLGVELTLCQTVLAAHGGDARQLPAGVATGGMVGVLSGRAGWQLVLG